MPSLKRAALIAGDILLLGVVGLFACTTPADQRTAASGVACGAADSTAVLDVVTRFRAILSTGDTTGIRALLAPNLRVLESGTVENLEEYLSHHLFEDIAFTKAVPENRTSSSYTCEADAAWLVSTSTAVGKFGSRDINSVGAELLLLTRAPKGWVIRAIHWSSQKRQPR